LAVRGAAARTTISRGSPPNEDFEPYAQAPVCSQCFSFHGHRSPYRQSQTYYPAPGGAENVPL
ncbi:MAG: hypothetical protein ACK53L_22315, partial [Pirellulaceae bacterium]